ncbi:hypothetical protein F5Y11DRAFT_352827 [Daldinia sp. FL1419]|nr:hypothetical protein F5Y11DRAFT_352827 [Daldinia sp. FL1419]
MPSSSPRSIPTIPPLSLLDNSAQRLSLLDECRMSLGCQISPAPSLGSDKPAETNVLEERAKTLRALEQPRGFLGTVGPSKPESRNETWRYGQSFLSGSGPGIEPKQLEDFRRYFEEELDPDLSLCVEVWSDLTKFLLDKASVDDKLDRLLDQLASETISFEDMFPYMA